MSSVICSLREQSCTEIRHSGQGFDFMDEVGTTPRMGEVELRLDAYRDIGDRANQETEPSSNREQRRSAYKDVSG